MGSKRKFIRYCSQEYKFKAPDLKIDRQYMKGRNYDKRFDKWKTNETDT
jgi:hypothetical protein